MDNKNILLKQIFLLLVLLFELFFLACTLVSLSSIYLVNICK